MSLKYCSKLVRANEGKMQMVLGDEEIVKLRGSDTAGQFLLIEQNSLPGVGIPMHIHKNEDEVFRVLDGQLKVVVDREESILGPGDTIFCPRNIPHSWEIVGTGRSKVLLMIFPSGLEFMLEELAALGADHDHFEVESICESYDIKFIQNGAPNE